MGFSLNQDASRPYCDPQTEVYSHRTNLILNAEVEQGWEHEGEHAHICIGIQETEMQRPSVTEDYLVKDKHGDIEYVRHRGALIPRYDCPKNIGYMSRCRNGQGQWQFNIWMSPTPFHSIVALLHRYDRPHVTLTVLLTDKAAFIINFDVSSKEM